MPLRLGWEEIVLRLALTLAAGVLIGFNRGRGGHPAGLRTTMLVCLSAALSMIMVNLLLPTAGKSSNSFATLDPMRLPLGVLTGMGFIGGGAILRKEDSVQGVTTAATLWVATMIGLCLGAGLLGLGTAATVLALFVLWCMKWVEEHQRQVHHARLEVMLDEEGPGEDELRAALVTAGLRVGSWGFQTRRRGGHIQRSVRCELHWKVRKDELKTPEVVRGIAAWAGVRGIRWEV